MKEEKPIPKWQQGPPSWAFKDVQDKMSPRERRNMFIWDIVIACSGVGLIFAVGFFL